MKQFAVAFDMPDYDRLVDIAAKRRSTVSQLIRSIVGDYLDTADDAR